MIREISLKLSRTARRAFFTFFSGGQNRLNSLSKLRVQSGMARLLRNERQLENFDWKCEIVTQLLHLLLVLCDGARLLKNR